MPYPNLCSLGLYSSSPTPTPARSLGDPDFQLATLLTSSESRFPEIPCSLESLEVQPPNQALQL